MAHSVLKFCTAESHDQLIAEFFCFSLLQTNLIRPLITAMQVGTQSWFGGGCDLTPFYVNNKDFSDFHSFWKSQCDKHSPKAYSDYKAICDR